MVFKTYRCQLKQWVNADVEATSSSPEDPALTTDVDLVLKTSLQYRHSHRNWRKMPSRTSLAVKEVIPVCNGSKHSLSHERLGLLWSQCSFIILKVPEPLRMIYFASALKMEHLSLWSTKSSLHVYWRKILIFFFWGSGRHMVLWYGPGCPSTHGNISISKSWELGL